MGKRATWSGADLGIDTQYFSSLYQCFRNLQNLDSVPPGRVFQILLNNSDRTILFSWPTQGFAPEDYGRLAAEVQMQFSQGQASSESDAKTSCTRRYKANQQSVCADGAIREIESILIPYGEPDARDRALLR